MVYYRSILPQSVNLEAENIVRTSENMTRKIIVPSLSFSYSEKYATYF